MARAQSLNYEVDIDGFIVHPLTLGEFSEGAEGLIDVADGSRKYKIRDQIYSQEEVELSILMKDDKLEYNIMQNAVKSGTPIDVYVTGRDSNGVAVHTWAFKETDFTYGKKSAFDRNSKSADTKSYMLLPRDIVEI